MATNLVYGESTSVDGTGTVYTCPTGKVALIHAAVLNNSDLVLQEIESISLGGSLYSQGYKVPVEGTVLSQIEGQVLTAGQTLQITATGGFISLRVTFQEKDL